MSPTLAPIRAFVGQYRFLSNFYACPAGIVLAGDSYTTVEHAFQAAKTENPAERAFVRASAYPGQAKQRGRKVTLRVDWETAKQYVMYSLVLQKFTNDSILRQALLQTGDRELIEGNKWGDTYW